MIALAGLTIVLCTGCGPGTAPSREQDVARLQATIDRFYATIEEGDGEARIAMFTDDAIMMPDHWTRVEGREAIAGVVRSGQGAIFRLRNRERLDMGISGDLAYTVNAYEYTYHAAGDTAQWHRTKNVHVWRRDAAGDWKLHVDIWNSDVPVGAFDDE